jgi:hypothetical protein
LLLRARGEGNDAGVDAAASAASLGTRVKKPGEEGFTWLVSPLALQRGR